MTREPSEIARLTERISKDPRSKLFVQLAEEYKKAGDLEMAVQVLSEGLANNPEYITARSVLGKYLLEKGSLADAEREFEAVVSAVPDNIMAHRHLGDLQVLQNNPEEAISHYTIVLNANPQDEELASLIARLGGEREIEQEPQPAAGAEPEPEPVPEPEQSSFLSAPEESESDEPFFETTPLTPAQFFEEEVAEEVLVVEPLEDEPVVEEEAPSSGFETALQQELTPQELPAEEEITIEPLAPSDEEAPVETEAEETDGWLGRESEAGEEMEEPAPSTVEKEWLATPQDEGIGETPGEAEEAAAGEADDFTTDTLAELYIAQGFYEKAIDIYERMLADKPGSAALTDKLDRVREMAAEAAASEGTTSPELAEAPQFYEEEFGEETEDYPPPIEAEDLLIDEGLPGGIMTEVRPEAAEELLPAGQPAQGAVDATQAAIDRLENWLRAIQTRRT